MTNIFDKLFHEKRIDTDEFVYDNLYNDITYKTIEKYFKYYFKFVFIDYNDIPYSDERLNELMNRFESRIDTFCDNSNFFISDYYKFSEGNSYFLCFNEYSSKVNTMRKFIESMNFLMKGNDRFKFFFKDNFMNIHRLSCMNEYEFMFNFMKELYSEEEIVDMINKHKLYDYSFRQTDRCWKTLENKKDEYLFIHNDCDLTGFFDKYFDKYYN